jgi:non-canonical purine NTP pyrophosphatase, rdgB/HAM1 family
VTLLEVVLATHNAHKAEEFQRILGREMPELRVAAYDGPEPVEDGVTFADNALIKARAAAAHTGRIALADDSGICVDVLGGAPGIFSARWAGGHGDAVANLRLLLDQLGDIRHPHRGAQFRCTIALVVPEGMPQAAREVVVEGVWPGRVAFEPRGSSGFGYDPIFIPDGGDMSAAELTAAEKNAASHRARAFQALIPALRAL